jgi:aryl-alcohol dehydrogenase-like predicted oxidoreductase
MKLTTLGRNGPQVSRLGLGCASMSQMPRNEDEGVATIHALLDAGVNLLNTADFYGAGHNEMLIGRAIRGRRDQALLSVKCGLMLSPTHKFLGLDGRPAAIKNFAAYSLQRLGVDEIDLFQLCRADPDVPYEESIGAIAELITEGKVRHLGVSEVGADLIRRAHAVHPVAALEIEYSLACRFIEREILPTARDLGIAVVAYRVLADGLLSGSVPEGRGLFLPPRLEGDNLAANIATCGAALEMAREKGITSAQLAVAWLLAQGEDIIPLIGMRRPARLAENLAIPDITLSPDELARLDTAFHPEAILGDRYPAFVQKFAAR